MWECFENPQTLLAGGGGLSRSMQDLVRNAVSEMRRYYSRKVIDVLIKVTRTSLDTLRKRFNLSMGMYLLLGNLGLSDYRYIRTPHIKF